MGEIGGLRAYARHRGVTLKAVQKRRDAGAITVGEDGKIDFEQADGEWTASTSRNGHRHGHRPGTLVEAQRRLALARARLARLEYRKRRGELVDAGKVRQSAFTTGRRVATRSSASRTGSCRCSYRPRSTIAPTRCSATRLCARCAN